MLKETTTPTHARRSKLLTYLKAIIRASEACIVIIASGIIISTFFITVLQVRGNSMEPTLHPGEIIVSSHSDDFKRGDQIAFYYNNRMLLKRVIAFPNDTVDIKTDGSVYVNGELLIENYLDKNALEKGRQNGEIDIVFPYTVPAGRYFVLGDQRNISIDSRYKTIGSIAEEQIIGRLLLRVWPLSNFTVFE